jgi:L-asparaginase II
VKTYSGGVALASIERNGFIEGWHHGSVVVLDAQGDIIASAGDVHGPILPRSSNKPFQTTGMMRVKLPVTEPESLAVITASHYGEDMHLAQVRYLLTQGGLTEADLRTPPDWCLSRQCGPKEPIFMNCSGKHAGMLLTCIMNGWSKDDYYEPSHPLQKTLTATIEELTGESVSATAVDGCGAPALAVSLLGLASGFLRVSGGPVADAMRAHPEMVSGTGRDDALLMRAVPGLMSKVGAEAVWAAAIPGVGAVALKIDDGGARARGPVMASALRHLGITLEDPALTAPALLGRGHPVGAIRALW